jgi:hypothetical protein
MEADMSDSVAETTFGPLESYPDDNPKTVLGLAKPSTFAIPPSALIHLGGRWRTAARNTA